MKIGLGHMGHSSKDFWAFSLREWMLAVEGYRTKVYGPDNSVEPLDRDELEALMEEYPDAGKAA